MLHRLHDLGSRVSDELALIFGHTLAQLLVVIGCVVWLATGRDFTMLGDAMSVGAFMLAQVILNQQRRRERALQLKLDELVRAQEGARDELDGAETMNEKELDRLDARKPS